MHTSPLVRSVFLGGFFLLLCAAGCVGGDAPKDPYPTPDAGGGGHAGKAPDRDAAAPDTTKAGAAASRFPLVAGSTWTYRHVTPDKDPWDEVATLSDITYDGAPAFVLADQEDAQGAETRSTLVVQGTGVYRAFREVRVHDALALQVRYDPAFLRFDESWDTNGQTETLDDDWVQTCLMTSVASKCAPGAVKTGKTTHVYTVVDPHAEVSVPAGKYDAIEIERYNPDERETRRFWFAAGVGKVREQDVESGASEELSDYHVAS